MVTIPQNYQYRQTNRSDIFGNISTSFNLDLTTNLGKLRISPRLTKTTDSATTSNLGLMAGVRFFASSFYAICGDRVFTGGYPSSTFTADTGTPTTHDANLSDIEIFTVSGTNYLFTTDGNGANINRRTSAGTWSTPYTSLTVNKPHLFTKFGTNLYVTDFTVIKKFDSSFSVTSPIAIDNTSTTFLTWLRSSSNRIWVGTLNTTGGKGAVYEWDGDYSQFTRQYKLQSAGALACVILDDIPYIVDANAKLLVFTGGNFKEIARFPVGDKFLKNSALATASGSGSRFIHYNGMSVVNGKIRILINNQFNDSTGGMDSRCPSGIWEYDENIGLYHVGSPTTYDYSGGTNTDFGQIKLSAVGALSEAKISDTSASNIGDMLMGATYYTDATSTASAIWNNDTTDSIQKSGYFVTTKIHSDTFKDYWDKVYVMFRKFLASTDKIIIKKRKEEIEPVEATITWTSTSQFTTTADISNFEVGDEVEVIQGVGSGKQSVITLIDKDVVGATTTSTITVEDTFTSATGTSKAMFYNFKKAGIIDNQTDTDFVPKIDQTSNWVQLKFIFVFTGKGEFEKANLVSESRI